MRGQAALEYLLLSALALSLILFSASALSGMKDSAEVNSEMLSFRSDALSLADAMAEVCALGDGNGRGLSLSADLAVESENTDDGVLARFSSKNATLVLWNEQIDTVKTGAKIKIENGDVNEWQGAAQLTLGKFGKLTVL